MIFLKEKNCQQHQIQGGLTVSILESLSINHQLKHTTSCCTLLPSKVVLMVCIYRVFDKLFVRPLSLTHIHIHILKHIFLWMHQSNINKNREVCLFCLRQRLTLSSLFSNSLCSQEWLWTSHPPVSTSSSAIHHHNWVCCSVVGSNQASVMLGKYFSRST